LTILACLIDRADPFKRRVLPLLAAGFAGSVLAALLLVLAPGNEARIASSVSQAVAPAARTWFSFVNSSLRFGFDSILTSTFGSRSTALAAFVLPAILAFKLHDRRTEASAYSDMTFRNLKQWLFIAPLIAFVLIVFCFVPTGYVAAYIRGGYRPQARLLVTSQFVFFCFACLWGYGVGVALKQSRMANIAKLSQYLFRFSGFVAALLLVVPFNAARRTLALSPMVRNFASMWDEQDRDIRSAERAGVREVAVRALPATGRDSRGNLYFGLRLIDSNPANWVNGCAAEYYGVDRIVAKVK
jgi:hypothetical protein